MKELYERLLANGYTIEEIAAHAGVSVATLRRVLGGRGRPQTARRVERAIVELLNRGTLDALGSPGAMPVRYVQVGCDHLVGRGILRGDWAQVVPPALAGRSHGVVRVRRGNEEPCFYWVDENGLVYDVPASGRPRLVGRVGRQWEVVEVATGIWRGV